MRRRAACAELSAAIVTSLQAEAGTEEFLRGAHVVATARHFVGDGGAFEGRNQRDSRSSESELQDIHAAVYPPAIRAGVQSVMASFLSWRQLKILLNCFERAGARMQQITAPFVVSTAGSLGLSLASIRLEAGVADAMPCAK